MKKNQWKYLDSYVKSFKKNEGCSEQPTLLPYLVIYFRQAFEKLGVGDVDVPEYFNWDDETAEEFFSWGHNSRWNHVFTYMLLQNLKEYVNILKKDMSKNNIKDFHIKIRR